MISGSGTRSVHRLPRAEDEWYTVHSWWYAPISMGRSV